MLQTDYGTPMARSAVLCLMLILCSCQLFSLAICSADNPVAWMICASVIRSLSEKTLSLFFSRSATSVLNLLMLSLFGKKFMTQMTYTGMMSYRVCLVLVFSLSLRYDGLASIADGAIDEERNPAVLHLYDDMLPLVRLANLNYSSILFSSNSSIHSFTLACNRALSGKYNWYAEA